MPTFFRAQLDSEIAGLERQIALANDQLDTMHRISSPSEELKRRGAGLEAKFDEERVRVSDLERNLAEELALLRYAKVRRLAADSGVFITAAGEDPEWARGWRLELKSLRRKERVWNSRSRGLSSSRRLLPKRQHHRIFGG